MYNIDRYYNGKREKKQAEYVGKICKLRGNNGEKRINFRVVS